MGLLPLPFAGADNVRPDGDAGARRG